MQSLEPLARQLASVTNFWAWLTASHRAASRESVRHTSTEDMTPGESRVMVLMVL